MTTPTPTRPSPTKQSPRFVDSARKTFAWPCPRPSLFSIVVVYEMHDVTMQLTGELDLSSIEAFDDCVGAACSDWPRRLVLELSALEFIDATGVNGLFRARQRTEETGIELVLDSPTTAVSSVIALTSADGDFFVR